MKQLSAHRARGQDGMALVLVLLVIAALTLLAIAGTRSAQTELQMGDKDLFGRQALSAAEAGINHAYSLIKNNVANRPSLSAACTQCGFDGELSGSGTGGALASIGSTATIGTQTYRFRVFGGGTTDGYYVQAADNYDEQTGANNATTDRDGKVYLVARGRVGTADRTVTALVTGTPLFSTGVFAKNLVTLGGSATIDSFDSRDGAYSAGSAGSSGNVRSDGGITLGGSATIKGDATASGTVTLGTGHVTGTVTNSAPALTFPSVPACGPPWSSNTGISPSTAYTASTGVLFQGGGPTVTLAGGTYCFSSVGLGGNSILQVSSAVSIYVTANSDLSGGTIANTTLNASNLKIFSSLSSTTQGVKLGGSSQAYAAVYAPDAVVTFGGTSQFYGAVVAYKVDDQAGVGLHYDQSLINVLGPGVTLTGVHEVRN